MKGGYLVLPRDFYWELTTDRKTADQTGVVAVAWLLERVLVLQPPAELRKEDTNKQWISTLLNVKLMNAIGPVKSLNDYSPYWGLSWGLSSDLWMAWLLVLERVLVLQPPAELRKEDTNKQWISTLLNVKLMVKIGPVKSLNDYSPHWGLAWLVALSGWILERLLVQPPAELHKEEEKQWVSTLLNVKLMDKIGPVKSLNDYSPQWGLWTLNRDKQKRGIQCCVELTKLRLFVSRIRFIGTCFTSISLLIPLNNSKRLENFSDDALLLFVLDAGDEDDLLLFVLGSGHSSTSEAVTAKFIAATSLLWLTIPPMPAKKKIAKMNKLSPIKAFVLFWEE
eukprot:scaffold4833_cov153-Skeletonema_dohrnii-CCMP3373.AAC.1